MHLRTSHKVIIAILLTIVVVATVTIIFICTRSSHPEHQDNTAETSTNSLEFIPADDDINNNITIPATTGIYMKSGQTKQTVDFWNPDDNPCYFQISLYLSDSTLIYQSDYIAPSEHITDITLMQVLQRGIYKNCKLVYNCYSLNDKTTLNSAEYRLEINLK